MSRNQDMELTWLQVRSLCSGNIFISVGLVNSIIPVLTLPRPLSCVRWAGGCGLLSLVSCTELHRLCTAPSHGTTPLCPGARGVGSRRVGGQSLSLSVPESPSLISPDHAPLLMQTKRQPTNPQPPTRFLCSCPIPCFNWLQPNEGNLWNPLLILLLRILMCFSNLQSFCNYPQICMLPMCYELIFFKYLSFFIQFTGR